MKGLTVAKRIILPREDNKAVQLLQVFLLILVAIICLPFIIMAWVYMLVSNALLAKNEDGHNFDEWYIANKSPLLILKRKTVDAETISEAAAGWFDTEPLILCRTEPELSFFKGYFTDFLVERADGLFVQKVLFDSKLEVASMPLYFCRYDTGEAEEIMDLKDYVISGTKGNADDFILSASSEEDEVELRFTRSAF